MISINESTVFEIIPYIGTNLVSFGMTTLQVEGSLGQSNKKSKDYLGTPVEFRSFMNVGYSENGIVDHIGFGRQMKNVIINNINLFSLDSSMALRELGKIDPEPLEYVGNLFFFKLGISLTGFHDDDDDDSDKAAALFMRGRWDSRKPKMKKFNILG